MSSEHAAAFAKTPLGIDALSTRRHGLAPRVRQLLILIDGQRTEAQLERLIPRAELDDYLPTLERGGFIARTGTPPLTPSARSPADAAQDAPDPHDEMRKRLVTALIEIAGMHGHELAGRIESCRSRRELREILPAARAIVEIVGGERAVAQFEERAGLR